MAKKAEKATVDRKQRLERVKVKDFMRLKTVEFSPRQGVIVICGKNDQGKSSLVRFIQCVLGGKYEFPEMPVRKGQKKAEGEIETQDFLWKWEYDPSKASPHTVTVRDKARGRNVKSPQSFTKRMFGTHALDLMRFYDMEPRDQLDYCKKIMRDKDGNEIDLEEYQVTHDEFFEDRREKKASLKSAAAVLDNNPPVADAPKERIDITALSKEIEKAKEHNDDIEKKISLRDEALERVNLAAEKVKDLEDQVVKAREELAEVKKEAVKKSKALDGLKMISTESLVTKRDDAADINDKFDRQKRHEDARAEHEKWQKAVDNVAEALQNHIDEHKQRMEEAQFPVTGLEWRDGRFTYNEIPLMQSSTRDKIFVAWQMAMAEAPEMPIALIDDANVFDEDAQEYFKELSSKHEADTIMVLVGEKAEDAQLVIRDGEAVK